MVDKIKQEELNESGYTSFGGTENRSGSFYNPTGPIGRFFAKFFATKAQSIAQNDRTTATSIYRKN